MGKHSLKEWVAATRYWSFPVSTMPVVVTFAYLFGCGQLPRQGKSVALFALSVLGVVLLHAAGNLLSDWSDYRKGVDNERAHAVPFLVFVQFRPQEYLRLSLSLFALGCTAGLAVCLLGGWQLLALGMAGVALTLLYSFLKYHALGDLDIFLIFGVIIVLGSTCAATGSVVWKVLLTLSAPLGIITVSVLHANNTVDIDTDRAAGIKTFAMLLGGKASCVLYRVYMALPFALVIGTVAAGWLPPLALCCLLAAIPAWKNARQAAGYGQLGTEAMKGLDVKTAQLQLAFSLLLGAGLFASAWA